LHARREWLLAVAASAVLLAPLAAVFVTDWGTDPLYWVLRPGPRVAIDVAGVMVGSRPAVAVCVVVLLGGALALRRKRHRVYVAGAPLFLAVWLTAPFVVLFAASQVTPVLVTRYLLPSVAALCIATAMAAALIGGWLGRLALVTIAILFLAATARQAVQVTNPNWSAIAARLRVVRTRQEPVVVFGGRDIALDAAGALAYYDPALGVPRDRLFWTTRDIERLPSGVLLVSRAELDGRFSSLALSSPGIWLLSPSVHYEEAATELAATCAKVESLDARGWTLRHGTGCAPA
jgi:hypothetical protein